MPSLLNKPISSASFTQTGRRDCASARFCSRAAAVRRAGVVFGSEALVDHRERRVLRHIEEWGPLTARALASMFMLNGAAIERILARILRRGLIRAAGYDTRGEVRSMI